MYFFFLFFFFLSICLDVPHLHIASLAAHTTLNTYNLWKLTLRGHRNTDVQAGIELGTLCSRERYQPLGHSSTVCMSTVKSFLRNLKVVHPENLEIFYLFTWIISRHFDIKSISDFFLFTFLFHERLLWDWNQYFFSVQNIASVNFPKGLFQYSPFFPNQRWLTCEIVADAVGFLFILCCYSNICTLLSDTSL